MDWGPLNGKAATEQARLWLPGNTASEYPESTGPWTCGSTPEIRTNGVG